MATRKSKKDKGGGVLRRVVAENLRQHMDVYFKSRPEIKNQTLWLAKHCEISLSTLQRTLSCDTGLSVDTLESIAEALGVKPYKFLVASARMKAMLLADDEEAEEQEDLHRRTSGQTANLDRRKT